MKTQPTTGSVIVEQHAAIMAMAKQLEAIAEAMEDDIDIEHATWVEVSQYAHVYDAVKQLEERL